MTTRTRPRIIRVQVRVPVLLGLRFLLLLGCLPSCGGEGTSGPECRADADCDPAAFCRAGVCLRWSSGLSDPPLDAGEAAPADSGG